MKMPCEEFSLEATLESGQVFGFAKDARGAYQGLISNVPVTIRQTGTTLHVDSEKSLHKEDFRNYFDLDYDFTLFRRLMEYEPQIRPAYLAFRGLRLIRQEPWEALACFILSSNNNVKRIQGIYRNISDYFLRRRKGKEKYFPTAVEIAKCPEKMLRQLGLGYRAPYLSRTAQFLSSNEEYLRCIPGLGYEEAVKQVVSFPGIGPKVADCVLLYGFHRLDAFPVDVWILRVMRKLYFQNRAISEGKVHTFAQKRWGNLAGYVQQYLFHGARKGVL